MTLDVLSSVLGWCLVINVGLLIWWSLLILLAHDFVYRLHTKWFKMGREQFDVIHYSGIAFYKILIIVFNAVPYFAIAIVK